MKSNKTARINVRIDPKLKNNTENILSKLGLTPTEAIILYYNQIFLNQGLPFDVKLPEKTQESINNVESDKDLTIYSSTNDMFKDLGINVKATS